MANFYTWCQSVRSQGSRRQGCPPSNQMACRSLVVSDCYIYFVILFYLSAVSCEELRSFLIFFPSAGLLLCGQGDGTKLCSVPRIRSEMELAWGQYRDTSLGMFVILLSIPCVWRKDLGWEENWFFFCPMLGGDLSHSHWALLGKQQSVHLLQCRLSIFFWPVKELPLILCVDRLVWHPRNNVCSSWCLIMTT